MSTKLNLRRGRTTLGGRLFQIDFWDRECFGCKLPWVGVYEVIEDQKGNKVVEKLREIRSGWMEEDRLEWARAVIAETVNLSSKKRKQEDAIDEFCRSGKLPDPLKPPDKGSSINSRA